MLASVKQERHDDREINDLARKIIEENKRKVAQPAVVPPGYHGSISMARPGQPGIQNFMRAPGQTSVTGGTSSVIPVESEKRTDEESRRGRFGWCEFEKNYIPYIFRSKGEKYTSVRMVERKLLNKFLSVLPSEVNSCHCIRSYYITEAEHKLLNEVNLKHADGHFGKEAFTSKDLVVRLGDAKEFYRFLDLCYKKLVLKRSNTNDRCGFFRINGESVVPYTMRNNVKYVPLFYFEGETDHLKLKSDKVEGWDLAYLKFCCKVQGIRNELFAADVCRVVALDEIRGHFPQGTTFEDYWPAKGSIEPVHAQRVSAGNWTQKPAVTSSITLQTAAALPQTAPVVPHSNGPVQSRSSSQVYQQQQQHLNTQRGAAATANALTAAAYDTLAFNQLQQQLMRQTAAAAARQQQQAAALQQQQLLRAAGYEQAVAAQAAAAARLVAMSGGSSGRQTMDKTFPGKLTQIKEFPMERSQQAPYKLQKALIDQKIVPCINVRPYVFHDLMMTLPDFVRHFYPELSIEKARHMLQEILKVVLYKGNSGHQEILRNEGKCNQFDPVPLVLVKDIMNYMPQMKYMFNNLSSVDPASKRVKLS